jgi:hypothetical protein
VSSVIFIVITIDVNIFAKTSATETVMKQYKEWKNFTQFLPGRRFQGLLPTMNMRFQNDNRQVETEVLGDKPAPEPLYLPPIPHELPFFVVDLTIFKFSIYFFVNYHILSSV